MKSLFIILALFAVAQASIFDYVTARDNKIDLKTNAVKTETVKTDNVKTGDHLFWTRQMNILKLYNHYIQPIGNSEQYDIAKKFNLETLVNKVEDKEAVRLFLLKWRDSMFLDKYDVFSITNRYHREDARLIVDLFMGCKDFDSFYEFACWTREHMNHDMFLYTMTVAVLNRNDCRGMRIPPMFEIVPNKFFNDEVIEIAKRIKMQGRIFDTREVERMGVKKVDERTFLINTFYSCWLLNTNEECKMNYFTEDVDLNNRYFIFNAMRPFWMYTRKDDMTKVRRGEYFLFMHQQLLNRYYMERLSNDLGDIPNFSYDLPIKTGMTTTLKHCNGLIMPSRPNDFLLKTVNNIWDIKRVEDYERRLRDAVDIGYITLDDGNIMNLNKPQDIEILGNLIQSNTDCPNRNYYFNGLMLAKKLLGNAIDTTDKTMTVPTILEQYETALRDPMFWQLWKRIIKNVNVFKRNLTPYTKQDVCFDGVTVTGIKTDKLQTFFDRCDSDISNAVYRDEEEMGKNRDRFTFIARQPCLKHRKFNVEIDYTSDKTTDAIVKVFLGTKFDANGAKTELGHNFLLIDNFLTTLKTGTNTIRRDSSQFWKGTTGTISYTKMLKKIEKCMTSECELDTTDVMDGFPTRLVLPKGKANGMMFQLYVSITPIKNTKTFQQCRTTDDKMNKWCNDLFVDDNALGYPLDREVDRTVFIDCTNMKMVDVLIHHDTRTDFMMNPHMYRNNVNKDFMINTNEDFMMKDRDIMINEMKKDDNEMIKTTEKDEEFVGKKTDKNFIGNKVIIDRFGNQHVYNFGNKLDRDTNNMDKEIVVNKMDKEVTGSKVIVDRFGNQHVYNFGNKLDRDTNNMDKEIAVNKMDKEVTGSKVIVDRFGNQHVYNFGNKHDRDTNNMDKEIVVNKMDKEVTGSKVIVDRFGIKHEYKFDNKMDKDTEKTDKDTVVNKMDKNVIGQKVIVDQFGKEHVYQYGNKEDKHTDKDKTGVDITINKDKEGNGNKEITLNKDGKDVTITKTNKDGKIIKVDKRNDITMTKTNDHITITSPYFTRTRYFKKHTSDSRNSDSSESDSKESKEHSKEKKELSKEMKKISK